MSSRTISWVFDVISPFAYLGLRQLRQIPHEADVKFVPVLFAALLTHHGQIGNAEIESKRRFTYRFALWRARKMGIAMRLPPSHPFNPLAALRLIVAAGSNRAAVERVFDAVWLEGRDAADGSVIAELAAELGVLDPQAALAAPVVKQGLIDNTNWAIEHGIFGVPTLVIDGEIFWGHDSFDMAVDYLRDPRLFADPAMQVIDTLPVGVRRAR
jgi:2-hydroxychromene-2-carboxylate isomerase